MRPADARGTGARAQQRWLGVGVLGVSGVAIVLFLASLWLSAGGGTAQAGATGVARLGAPGLSESATLDPPDTLTPHEAASVTSGAEPQALEPDAVDPPLVELPSVPLTEQVAPVPGLVFGIGVVRPVDVPDPARDDAGAPALRFSVSVRNDTDAPVALESTTVSLYAGAQQLPMAALPESSRGMLPARVAAGATVTGLYVFAVPAEAMSSLKVVVDYAVGAPRVVFVGSVPQ